MNQLLSQCRSDIHSLFRKVQCLFGIGRTSTQVNDAGPIRTVQAQLGYGQVKDNIPYMQHFGFASNPPVGADISIFSLNGDRSVAAILGTNHQEYILKNLGNGSSALYDMYGNTVVLSATGIAITSTASLSISAATNLNLTAQNIVIHATQSLKYDANGNGTEFTTNTRNDYVTGSTNNSHNLSPPQVP